MKKITATLLTLSAIVLIVMLLPGCFKDKVTHTYKIFTPVYKTTDEVRANIKSNVSQNIVNAGKLFIKDNYIFLNEVDKGIHIIDNSNPAAPNNVAFVAVPGNMDLAVKGNILYADLYTDLVAIDITDPLHVQTKKIVDNAFPERTYSNGFVADRSKIITDWVSRDTTIREDDALNSGGGQCINCMFYNSFAAVPATSSGGKSPFGIGGSTARFSIVKNSLYTVGNSDLKVFSISTPENPVNVNKISMQWGIETIYPFKDKLFIGSNSGMFIYDVANESNPVSVGQFSHLKSCDPVIADDKYAYVTLRSGVSCSTGSNQLDVLDIASLTSPSLIKSYSLSNPRGLSKDGNSLLICDGTEGLKIFDASDVNSLKLITNIKGFESNDVIAYNNLAIVVATDGLRQYDYSDLKNVKLLSRIGWAE